MSDKAKILVVEDNDFVRMQITKFLEEDGYAVVEASGGEEAIKQIDEGVDMAVVDVRMEPIDGFEFIRSIRGSEKDVPVILVTGDQNPDLLAEAAKWGVGAVLLKPVQKLRLVKAVSKTLEIKQRTS